MKNKVLVVAVHPDDDTLGCGGTLLKHKNSGDNIHWLICSKLSEKHGSYKKRELEIKKVSKHFNFKSVDVLPFETTKLDQYGMNEIVEKISKILKKIRPNIIYLPFKSDVHSDHKIIFEASYSCTKSFRSPYIKKIYMMETLSETEFSPSIKKEVFIPNTYVDITKFIDKKVKIMSLYKSEIKKHPFPRSKKNIKALANFRGATSGFKFAESFMLLKEIK